MAAPGKRGVEVAAAAADGRPGAAPWPGCGDGGLKGEAWPGADARGPPLRVAKSQLFLFVAFLIGMDAFLWRS